MNKVIVGCDISKDKLDFYCVQTEEHFVLPNSYSGFMKLLKWANQYHFELNTIHVAFENTGAYSRLLGSLCSTHGITHYELPAIELKRSLGLVRGKNDMVDAKRIAIYLEEKINKLKPSTPKEESIIKLSRLRSQRAQLIKQRTANMNNLRIYEDIDRLAKNDLSIMVAKKMIQELNKGIERIQIEISKLIDEHKAISKNYEILTSCIGIGRVNAIMILTETHNFKRFTKWRSLACYCGCAPFENRSGKFKGKTETSNLAHKEMKTLLTSAARSAAIHDPEIKRYYEKKLNEGKNKQLVVNAIRCKLIARMFALVRDQRKYEKNYTQNLAA